ncbi:MAG: endonuclease V [Thermomicrobiales bacterium]
MNRFDAAQYRDRQLQIAKQVAEFPLVTTPKLVGAVDMHLFGEMGVAVALTMSLPELEILEIEYATGDLAIPYIPGYLSFREAPLCLEAIRRLESPPDLLLVDGHGKAHPTSCGLACHIGVEADLPTIGIAKGKLVGEYVEPGIGKGEVEALLVDGVRVGSVVRTREGVRPVFVSVGHRITLTQATSWTLRLARRFRLPEPSHKAHKLASARARQLRGTGP